MNAKYGSLFVNQSNYSKQDTETKRNTTESEIERKNDQSDTNRTFQNKSHVNKVNESENTTSGQSEISTAKASSKSKEEETEKMNRENLYLWGATREIMEIIMRRNKPRNTETGRKKRSVRKARNNAEKIRHAIPENDIHTFETEIKKPERDCGD